MPQRKTGTNTTMNARGPCHSQPSPLACHAATAPTASATSPYRKRKRMPSVFQRPLSISAPRSLPASTDTAYPLGQQGCVGCVRSTASPLAARPAAGSRFDCMSYSSQVGSPRPQFWAHSRNGPSKTLLCASVLARASFQRDSIVAACWNYGTSRPDFSARPRLCRRKAELVRSAECARKPRRAAFAEGATSDAIHCKGPDRTKFGCVFRSGASLQP